MTIPIVYEGFDGVEVSGDEVLQEMNAFVQANEPECRVCGAKATRRLEINIGTTDPDDFEYYPVEMLVHFFCGEHGFPQVDYSLHPQKGAS